MQEENSSSPRDNSIIQSIRKKRSAGENGFIIKLSDGTSFFLLEDVFYRNFLSEGQEVSLKELQSMEMDSLVLQAERKAFGLLSRGMHTRFQLEGKLLKRGFPQDVVERTLKRMEEIGYLDDMKYAETWIELRKRNHPEGKMAMVAGLVRRGIDHDVAERKVKELCSDDDELRAARKVYEALAGNSKMTAEKLYRALLNRGFHYRIVSKLVEEFRNSTKGST